MDAVIFSSQTDEWATPQDVFDQLNNEFAFNLDPCATDENHKCKDYYTAEQDGLRYSWRGKRVFCNPPYSEVGKWAEKCYREGQKDNTLVVMLIPARTDTKFFHNFIYHRAEVRFLKGRLKYGDADNSAPFPTMVVIFRGAYV